MPNAFGLLNAGVILYRARERVFGFFAHWLELYLKDLSRKLADPAVDKQFTRSFQRQPAMYIYIPPSHGHVVENNRGGGQGWIIICC